MIILIIINCYKNNNFYYMKHVNHLDDHLDNYETRLSSIWHGIP